MSNINCNACETLKNTSPHFVANGVTSTECTSLAADTGLNPNLTPKHNDATDLHTMNDCLIGRQAGELEEYNVCDWQDFMEKFIANLYEMLKGIICALGGVWTHIHSLLTRVSGLETRMTSVEGRVTTLESDVGGLKTRVTNLEGDVSGLKMRVTSLEDDMDDVKSDVSNLKTDVTGLSNRMTTLESTVGGFNSRIGTLESNYTSLSSTVTNLGNTVSGHTTTINNLSSTVGNHTTSINQNTADIAALTTKLNNLITALGGSSTTVPVMKRYRVTVPVGAFGQVWRVTSGAEQAYDPNPGAAPGYYSVANVTEWFAGSGNNAELGEFRVVIPITDMEAITGVWTQTQVVPSGNPYDGRGKGYIQTVNVQGYVQEGSNLIVNFDTFELCPASMLPDSYNGGPYPVTIDFLVVGTKTFSPI